MIRAGVRILMGPSEPTPAVGHLKTLSTQTGVPHVLWQAEGIWSHRQAHLAYPSLQINLHPAAHLLGRMLSDLIREFKWERILVLHDSFDGTYLVNLLISLSACSLLFSQQGFLFG